MSEFDETPTVDVGPRFTVFQEPLAGFWVVRDRVHRIDVPFGLRSSPDLYIKNWDDIKPDNLNTSPISADAFNYAQSPSYKHYS